MLFLAPAAEISDHPVGNKAALARVQAQNNDTRGTELGNTSCESWNVRMEKQEEDEEEEDEEDVHAMPFADFIATVLRLRMENRVSMSDMVDLRKLIHKCEKEVEERLNTIEEVNMLLNHALEERVFGHPLMSLLLNLPEVQQRLADSVKNHERSQKHVTHFLSIAARDVSTCGTSGLHLKQGVLSDDETAFAMLGRSEVCQCATSLRAELARSDSVPAPVFIGRGSEGPEIGQLSTDEVLQCVTELRSELNLVGFSQPQASTWEGGTWSGQQSCLCHPLQGENSCVCCDSQDFQVIQQVSTLPLLHDSFFAGAVTDDAASRARCYHHGHDFQPVGFECDKEEPRTPAHGDILGMGALDSR